MNNSKTPKIVVGVGLVAVYAAIAGFVMHDHSNVVAQSAPAESAAPLVAETAAPPSVTQAPSDGVIPAAESPPAIAPAQVAQATPPAKHEVAKSSPAKPSPIAKLGATAVASTAEEKSVTSADNAPPASPAADSPAGNDTPVAANVEPKEEAGVSDKATDATSNGTVAEARKPDASESTVN